MSWSVFPLVIARTAGYEYDVLGRLADPSLTIATADFPDRYAAACVSARRELVEVLTDPRVREGIAVLAPDALRWTVPRVDARRTGGPDKYERKLLLFLQRLVAKCDTNAIAGNVAYVALAPELGPLLPDLPIRRGFVAHWVLSELLLARAVPELAERKPVLGPAAALLDPAASAKFTALVGDATRWADVRGWGHRLDERTALNLHRRGVVWSAPVLPVAEPDALAAAGMVGAGEFPELAAMAREYAASGATDKLATLRRAEDWVAEQGLSEVRRGAGAVYQDRTVLYAEHHEPSAATSFPVEHAEEILAALRPALDLAVAVGAWARAQARAQAAPAVTQLAGDRPRVPLREVLRALPGGYPIAIDQAPPVLALLAHIASADSAEGAPVQLAARDIGAACAGWLPAGETPLLASPDVFVSDSGDIVLGEVHAGLTLFGNLMTFVEDRDRLLRLARTWLSDNDPATTRLVNVAMGQRFGKVCHLEVMPRTLELTGSAAIGRQPLSVDDLQVDPDLQVWCRDERVELQLASGDGTMFSPWGPPAARHPTFRLPGASRMPRIVVGRCVLQRATWWFDGAECAELGRGAPVQRYRKLLDLATRAGLPRWVFVRVPSEPKPVHLDLANPLLADAVVRLLSRSTAEGEVRVSEMLPQPVPGGRMQEFRMSCVRGIAARDTTSSGRAR